jgi:protein-S-isoprenylcysteine O-methyltransferase
MAMDFDLMLYFIFVIPGFLIEMFHQLTKFSSSNTNRRSKSKDHGTFYLIWLIVMCSTGLSIHYVRLGYGWKICVSTYSRAISIPLSMCLFIAGRLIRQQAIQQLGKWFTMTICINDEQQLIESGWYGKMRHPSYTGILMIFFGLGLLMNNWLGLIGTVAPATLTFLYRIHVEEKESRPHFGSNYDNYAQRVPAKLIPYVF